MRNTVQNRRSTRSSATTASPSAQQEQQRMQEQFNQLVAEVRLLEAYYQEVTNRQQSVSAALIDARAALEALDTLSKNQSNELLVPVGAGTLIFATAGALDRIIVSVGAGVAIEKSLESAKLFLQARRQDLEKAITSLESQRKEIASRLEVGRATIQRITGSSE
jgi:prefoldin alpha subunit